MFIYKAIDSKMLIQWCTATSMPCHFGLFPCSYMENFLGLNYIFAACVHVVDLG